MNYNKIRVISLWNAKKLLIMSTIVLPTSKFKKWIAQFNPEDSTLKSPCSQNNASFKCVINATRSNPQEALTVQSVKHVSSEQITIASGWVTVLASTIRSSSYCTYSMLLYQQFTLFSFLQIHSELIHWN